jgi:hypothetical protein
MNVPRPEDSIDVTAAFAVLDTLMASRWRLAGALRRHGGNYRVLEHAPAAIGKRTGMTDRLALNPL